MRFEYKKSYRRSHLIFGSVWVLFFLIFTSFDEMRFHWTHFGYLAIAVMYLGMYWYQKRNGYLNLENGVLRLNDLRKKQINLNEVTHFKYFAGDYILETESKKLRINTQLLDPQDVLQLKTKLSEYGLQPGTNRKVQVESN